MKVTEVRIKLTGETDDRLLAFCSVTFDDCFVVRDLKVIGGPTGPFVAMPSRKLTGHCPKCRAKNNLRCNFCNQCGTDLSRESSFQTRDSHTRLYADIAHPINAECREMIQRKVIEEFNEEMQRSKLPGYQSRYDEEYDAGDDVREMTISKRTHVKKSIDTQKLDPTSVALASENDVKQLPKTSVKAPAQLEPGHSSKKHRIDEVKSEQPAAPHQRPEKSEKPAKPNDKRDEFGLGILD